MDRQKDNFLRDQSGMRRQLSLLQSLIALMDPALHRHLVETDSASLFMCFRWLIVGFKCVGSAHCAALMPCQARVLARGHLSDLGELVGSRGPTSAPLRRAGHPRGQ